MKKDQLPIIPWGTIPHVLLLGNGINRAFCSSSWEDLIKEIATVKLTDAQWAQINKMPYPLRPVVVTEDQVDKKIENIAGSLLRPQVTEEQGELLRAFAQMPFDAILTTNYTYEIEKAIDEHFYCGLKCASKYRKTAHEGKKVEKQFGLFQYMKVSDEKSDYRIWHIHGEAARPSSMILGHYYYGKLLSKIQQYVSDVKGKYEFCKKQGKDFQPKSWIDYFLIGNVHIVGFGLDFSELDLWWLINCKKRNTCDCGKVYFYEANLDSEEKLAKRMLAEAYGVEIVTKKVEGHYAGYYRELLPCVKKNVTDAIERVRLQKQVDDLLKKRFATNFLHADLEHEVDLGGLETYFKGSLINDAEKYLCTMDGNRREQTRKMIIEKLAQHMKSYADAKMLADNLLSVVKAFKEQRIDEGNKILAAEVVDVLAKGGEKNTERIERALKMINSGDSDKKSAEYRGNSVKKNRYERYKGVL